MLRAILVLLGLAAVVLAIGVATGMVSLATRPGELPTVKLEGGKAPGIDADVGDVKLGTVNKTVEVPTVEMTNTVVSVPSVTIEKAEPKSAPPAE